MSWFCKKEKEREIDPDFSRFIQTVFHAREWSSRTQWDAKAAKIYDEIKTSGRTVFLGKTKKYECLIEPRGYECFRYFVPDNHKYNIVWIDEAELSFPQGGHND